MPDFERWPEPADLRDLHGAGGFGGHEVFDNPDPVLQKLTGCSDVEVYENLGPLFPAAWAAYVQRRTTLLSKGWQVAEGEGPNGERNAEMMRAFFSGIVGFETLLHELHQSIWNGYAVAVALQPREITAGGLTFQAPMVMRAKKASRFGFTTDRNLVYRDSPEGEQEFKTNELTTGHLDLYRFLVVSTSTDNPYGVAQASFLYQIFRLWRGAVKDTATNIMAALGVLNVDDQTPGIAPGGYDEDTADNVREQLVKAWKGYKATGILQTPPNITATLESVAGYADQAVLYLRYLDEQATRAVLTVSLTTTLDGQGSRAAAQVQLGPMNGLCKEDGRMLAEPLERFAHRWLEFALGAPMAEEDKPRFRFRLSDPTNVELLNLLLAHKMPVDAEPLADEAGVRMVPEEGEELVMRGAVEAPVADEQGDEGEDEEPADEDEGDDV